MTSFKSSHSTKKPEPRFLRNLNSYYRAIRRHVSLLSTGWQLGGRKGRTGGAGGKRSRTAEGISWRLTGHRHGRACLPKGEFYVFPHHLAQGRFLHFVEFYLDLWLGQIGWVSSLAEDRQQVRLGWSVTCRSEISTPFRPTPLPTHHHRADAAQLSKPEPLANQAMNTFMAEGSRGVILE